MEREKLKEKYELLVRDPFRVFGVDTANHKPDIYTIGPRHIGRANAHGGMGILDKRVMEEVPCANCRKPLSEHTYDTVLFLQLTRHCTNEEANAALKPIADDLMKDGIDGVAFVETEERFRVQGEESA